MEDREIKKAGNWSLFSQWYCIPADLTDQERVAFLEGARDSLRFDGCPLAFIEDRMFGGFRCDEPNRRHVCFATGHYSYLAAGEGRFWPLDPNDRSRVWEQLLAANEGEQVPDPLGPFCEDRPS